MLGKAARGKHTSTAPTARGKYRKYFRDKEKDRKELRGDQRE
jgi:hypothetical protein